MIFDSGDASEKTIPVGIFLPRAAERVDDGNRR